MLSINFFSHIKIWGIKGVFFVETIIKIIIYKSILQNTQRKKVQIIFSQSKGKILKKFNQEKVVERALLPQTCKQEHSS